MEPHPALAPSSPNFTEYSRFPDDGAGNIHGDGVRLSSHPARECTRQSILYTIGSRLVGRAIGIVISKAGVGKYDSEEIVHCMAICAGLAGSFV